MRYTIPLKNIAADSPKRKRLKRELAAEALTRLEEAARTPEEFEGVTKWWDRCDANRERRERYYEQAVSNDMFDWDFEDWVSYEEDFLTIIFLCICQMHHLTSDPDVANVVEKASDKQKSSFFQRYILNRSTERIAHDNDMTDRNVRKLTDKMIENAQAGLFAVLAKKSDAIGVFSKRQCLFIEAYSTKDDKTKIVSIISHISKPSPKKKRGRKKMFT